MTSDNTVSQVSQSADVTMSESETVPPHLGLTAVSDDHADLPTGPHCDHADLQIGPHCDHADHPTGSQSLTVPQQGDLPTEPPQQIVNSSLPDNSMMIELIKEYFPSKHVHNYYLCNGNCTTLPASDLEVMKKSKRILKHLWLTDRDMAFSEETGTFHDCLLVNTVSS